MGSDDNKSLELLGLTAEERVRLEAEEKRRLADLAAEVSRRYDPSRLGKLSVAAAGKAEKLDDDTRRKMEARLGGNFRDVRVVRGAFADRVTRRHGADAVTIGATGLILLRDTPRTNTNTAQGRAVLAHELTHVKQARQGFNFALEQGSSGHAHEQEAHAVERAVLRDEKATHSMTVAASAGEVDPMVFQERVIARVVELVDDEARHDRDRRGLDDR